MSNILVRDLDARIINRLKSIAKQHKRSLQGEIKAILTDAATFLSTEAVGVSARWHERLAGRKLKDSASLVREDRDH